VSATLAVALGGALGSVGRYWISVWSILWLGPAFPYGTIFINVLGSFVIGLAGGLPGSDLWRHFLMVGVCGGFTTFSAFSLQTFAMARSEGFVPAAANVLLSLVLCLLAVTAGFLLAERITGHTMH
jgi:CrcB protein